MKKNIYGAFILLLLAGCATTQALTVGGRYVEVVTELPDNMQCRFVAPVSAEWGSNFQTFQTNQVNAYNDVRNQAHAYGATHLVITDSDTQDATGLAAAFGASTCENCVLIQGQAYSCY